MSGRPPEDTPIMPLHRPDAIALQLWTVRNALAADLDGTLARIRAAGFAAVELAPPPPGVTAEALVDKLDRHGLSVTSIHADLPTPGNAAELDRLRRASRCATVVWHGWPRDPRFDTLDGVRTLVAAYNRAAATARDLGMRLLIHNHWWEFEPVEGVRPIDLFAAELDPDIGYQVDVYWAQTAGADPVGVLRQFAARVRSLHLKDGPAVHGPPMVPLGQGVVDIAATVGTLLHPVDWVIELDECATDPLEAARVGLEYLRSFG